MNILKIRMGGMCVIVKMFYYNYNFDGKRSATGFYESYVVFELIFCLVWIILG